MRRFAVLLLAIAVIVDPIITSSPVAAAAAAGRCERYVPLFRAHGLPVATFKAIAWRESRCNHRSFVIDRDDAGGGLLGLNLRGRLAGTWRRWCGLTLSNVTNADRNVRCAAVAYRKLGTKPWR